MKRITLQVLCAGFLIASTAWGQTEAERAAANPVAKKISLEYQSTFQFDFGEEEKTGYTGIFQPVLPVTIGPRIPAGMPAKIFWSVSVYNAYSASGVDNGQRFPSINSMDPIKYNKDGSSTFYFGPKLPKGAPESNFLRTIPGDGWFTLFRLYGPMKPYFDGGWELPDIEKMK